MNCNILFTTVDSNLTLTGFAWLNVDIIFCALLHCVEFFAQLWTFLLNVTVCFLYQEEDSEEEPKLKYERLSNGVTEILQKDAASCMTVHDKVEVIIHQPRGHFRSPQVRWRVHIVYVDHLRDVLFKVSFHLHCSICKGSPFFSHLVLLFLSGSCIKRRRAPLSSFFMSPATYFSLVSSVCWMLVFLKGPLSARRLVAVAPAAHVHAWEEQKSYPVMFPCPMFY